MSDANSLHFLERSELYARFSRQPRVQIRSVRVGGTGGNSGLTNGNESGTIDKDKECVIPDDKVNKYLLKEGTKHAEEFFDVGYTPSDGEKLKKDISGNFMYSKAVEKKTIDGSERFNVYMDLGVTKMKRFRTVWQKDGPESAPGLITAYRKDR